MQRLGGAMPHAVEQIAICWIARQVGRTSPPILRQKTGNRSMLPEQKSDTHTPTEAKALSMGLLVWIFFGALIALALFAYFRT
jgi:hypothetical protein